MKFKSLFVLFFIGFTTLAQARILIQNFDRSAFYAVMETGKLEDVNQELLLLDKTEIKEKQAYTGALLMRKAGLLKIPAEKLKFFKKGRIAMETALLNDNENGEYHFLRLTIQEHAPKIVKYHTELEADKKAVQKSFKNLHQSVQQAILSYSKTSAVLHLQDF